MNKKHQFTHQEQWNYQLEKRTSEVRKSLASHDSTFLQRTNHRSKMSTTNRILLRSERIQSFVCLMVDAARGFWLLKSKSKRASEAINVVLGKAKWLGLVRQAQYAVSVSGLAHLFPASLSP
jgi:hypothetical protein